MNILDYKNIRKRIVMKQKYFFLFIVLATFVLSVHGQNKIGDNPTVIQSGSLLELESLTKGLRLPRIPLNDVHAWTLDGVPVSGMTIFNETGTATKGVYYWSTELSQWVRVVNASELASIINTTVSNTSSGNTLSTTVNSVASTGVNIINSNTLNVTNGQLSSTVNGVGSSPVNVLSSGDNGLSVNNGNVQLGGVLTKPTMLSTSAGNTLSIKGLQEGDVTVDSLLVTTPTAGIVKKISTKSLGVNEFKAIASATEGQVVFSTPTAITDIKKIQVYRNGISIEFTQVDGTHIQLDPQSVCYANDEIKIIQLF